MLETVISIMNDGKAYPGENGQIRSHGWRMAQCFSYHLGGIVRSPLRYEYWSIDKLCTGDNILTLGALPVKDYKTSGSKR